MESHAVSPGHPIRALVWLVAGLALALASGAVTGAQTPGATGAHAPAEPAGRVAPAPSGDAGDGGRVAEHHEEPLWKSGARLFNFGVLAGTLVYFLRAPMRAFFDGRIATVRSNLVKAAEMRKVAGEQMAAIDGRMQALPGELTALGEKGARDIAAERARIREAAEAERSRLLAQSRAQAARRVKGAERELTAMAADRVIGAATSRIRAAITDADQARLIERYLVQVPEAGREMTGGGRA